MDDVISQAERRMEDLQVRVAEEEFRLCNGMPMILAQIRDLNLFPPVMLHTVYNRDRLDNPSIRVA